MAKNCCNRRMPKVPRRIISKDCSPTPVAKYQAPHCRRIMPSILWERNSKNAFCKRGRTTISLLSVSPPVPRPTVAGNQPGNAGKKNCNAGKKVALQETGPKLQCNFFVLPLSRKIRTKHKNCSAGKRKQQCRGKKNCNANKKKLQCIFCKLLAPGGLNGATSPSKGAWGRSGFKGLQLANLPPLIQHALEIMLGTAAEYCWASTPK